MKQELKETRDGKNERREQEPQYKYVFFFTEHAFVDELESKRIQDMLDEADVIVPESALHPALLRVFPITQELLQRQIQSISDGVAQPPDVLQITHPFTYKFQWLISGGRKKIFIAEPPADDRTWQLFETSQLLNKQAQQRFYEGSFQAALDLSKKSDEQFVQSQMRREVFIKDALTKKLKDVISEDAHLRKKEKINVFIELGWAHTQIYHNLKTSGENTIKETSRTWHGLPQYQLEQVRRVAAKKKMNDKLSARKLVYQALLELVSPFNVLYGNVLVDDVKTRVARIIADKVDLDGVRGVCQIFQGVQDSNRLSSLLREALELQGIKVPHTIGEVLAIYLNKIPPEHRKLKK